MILKSKICGVSDSKTLSYIIDHVYPPQFVGFIVNYPKSSRFVKFEKLKELLNVEKKNCKFVCVLVKPDPEILLKIQNLPFDYYQIYDCSPEEIELIKNNHNKKIIVALTISDSEDIKRYKS